MIEPSRDDRLLAWCLATFHVGGFVLFLVMLLYLTGGLGSALGSLNTAVGLGLYGVLWATNWWATRQVVRGLRLAEPDRPVDGWELIGRGGLWGGVTGTVVWLILLALLTIQSLAGANTRDLASLALGLALFINIGSIGSVIAFVIGGGVGLVFVAIDWIILEIARALWRAGAGSHRGEPTVLTGEDKGDGHGSACEGA